MFKKGTKLYSIVNGKCPKCNDGEFFTNKFTFNPSKVTKIHDNCAKCNLKYMLEPAFFYGAMYVSYPVGIAFATAAFVIAYYMLNVSLLNSFFVIVATMIVFMPLIMRLSRNIWINFFFSYDKQKAKH